MFKRTAVLAVIIALFFHPGCKKSEINEVSIDQITIDRSNDYKYIFKDLIHEQKEKDLKHRKDPFKD